MKDSVGARSARRARHASRWHPGMIWDGHDVRAVFIVSEWHVVLFLDWGLVELDPHEEVVKIRRNDEAKQLPRDSQGDLFGEPTDLQGELL